MQIFNASFEFCGIEAPGGFELLDDGDGVWVWEVVWVWVALFVACAFGGCDGEVGAELG